MPNLRVRPKGRRGLVTEITPDSAGWSYVGFALHRLEAGESVAAETGNREVCLALVSGQAQLTIDSKDFGVQEMHFQLKKVDGNWLITRAETVKTLS